MKESTCLLPKIEAPREGEEASIDQLWNHPIAHPTGKMAVAITIVLVVLSFVFVSPSGGTPVSDMKNQVGPRVEETVDTTYILSQHQKSEIYEGWQLFLSWRDLWNKTEHKWGTVTQDKNLTWDGKNIKNYTYLWASQTEAQGKEWWENARNWFQNISEQVYRVHQDIMDQQDLTPPVVEEDKLYIHENRPGKHHRHHGRSLVFMNQSDAFALLADHDQKNPLEYSSDYFLLNEGLDAQINQAYCAVATSMALLNSMRGIIDLPQDPIYDPYPYATQSNAFNDCTDAHVIQHNDTFRGILSSPFGLNLDSAKGLLKCHLDPSTWSVEAHHVDPTTDSISSVADTMLQALRNPKARLMINYHRAAVGQIGGGHFSPVGAYSPTLGAFLVMDVAKYKYPPVWIPTELLYHSLATVDNCGAWDGPVAQAELPNELLHPESADALKRAMSALNCQATRRGFIVVSPKE